MMPEQAIEIALEEARKMGAEYAEARAETDLSERVQARNGEVERFSSDNDAGWGIHVLAGGGWGFSSSASTEQGDIRATVQSAVDIARASGTRRKSHSDVSLMPTEQGEYATLLAQDPLAVPLNERVGLMQEVSGRILSADSRVKVATASLGVQRAEKVYANTQGARIRQRIT